MKTVILAGGLGSRLAEQTEAQPKPMVEIGQRPILWHILKHYAHYGFNEFVIALGYKGDVIKRYFLDYYRLNSNFTIHLINGKVESRAPEAEDWVIHLIDTGIKSLTGGRVKRLAPWIGSETFMLTYGDGVANLDLKNLLKFHHAQGRIATVTAVRPPARFGGLEFSGDLVSRFTEKPQIGEGWINGGYMVFEPRIFDYIADDQTILETDILESLATEGQLSAYRHEGFWQCMDTIRDLRVLEELWNSGKPGWKMWE
jgi:glucose-1-phosphate cytidylyltransferase